MPAMRRLSASTMMSAASSGKGGRRISRWVVRVSAMGHQRKTGRRSPASPSHDEWAGAPLFGRRRRDDRDDLPVALGGAEAHGAGEPGIDGVIIAHAHPGSRVPGGAALADDDVAGDDLLAAEML